MADKKSFVFYHEWGEILKKMPVEEVGNITLALITYSECGVIPTLSPIADIAFTAFKQTVDRDFEKWESTCQTRAENGRKGGRPKKPNGFLDNQNKPNGFLAFSEKPKKADNEYDIDNEYDNEYESDMPNKSPPPPSKPKFQKFGEYSHVKLTQKQFQKLIADFGEAVTAEYIRRCDEYQQQTGKSYKDYNLTIRHWIDKDGGIKSVQTEMNKSKYTNPYDMPLFDE